MSVNYVQAAASDDADVSCTGCGQSVHLVAPWPDSQMSGFVTSHRTCELPHLGPLWVPNPRA